MTCGQTEDIDRSTALNLQEQIFFADPLNRQLAQMLKLQDEMNCMVNRQWRTAGYAWHRAIMVEGVELMEHFGQWKWWKKGEPDNYQAQLELVDIWHFALSWYMVRFGIEDPSDWVLVQAIARRVREGRDALDAQTALGNNSADVVNADIDRLVSAAGRGLFDHVPFVRLMVHFGMDFDMLFRMYVGKNGLNRFRQMFGYKQGAYLKNDWDGLEDNAALEKLLPEVVREPDPMASLLDKLEATYSRVCSQKPWYAVPEGQGKFRVVEGDANAATPGAQRLPVRVG